MPGCTTSCPKVKRELKRRNAERKKALEGEAASSLADDRRKALELNPEYLGFANRRNQNEENDQRSQNEIKSNENNYLDANSRAACCASSSMICDPGEYISNQDEDFNSSNHKLCSSKCCLQRFKEEIMKKQLEAKQKTVDNYLSHEGMNYFSKFCICSSMCLAKQLWYDPFVKKIIISASLFALGIKLCCEMDAWYIPT